MFTEQKIANAIFEIVEHNTDRLELKIEPLQKISEEMKK